MVCRFYVGSYAAQDEEGITRFTLDTDRKTLTKTYGFRGIYHPSWILTDRAQTRMYAVQEQVPEGKVHELKLLEEQLQAVRSFESGGADPCHLSLAEDETLLLAANYTSGSLAAFGLDGNGGILKMCGFDQHYGKGVNPVRQECAHVHFSGEHGGLIYVCDLGTDQVFVYQPETDGGIKDTGERLILPDGQGPRHLEFHEDIPAVIYILCELGSSTAVFEKSDESWKLRQLLSNLPENFAGENIGSSIRKSGDLLFCANRGHDSVAVFEILPDGSLKRMAIVPTGGKTPRDMAVMGDYLIIANQDSDRITVLEIDRKGKTLNDTGISASVMKPSCICPIR